MDRNFNRNRLSHWILIAILILMCLMILFSFLENRIPFKSLMLNDFNDLIGPFINLITAVLLYFSFTKQQESLKYEIDKFDIEQKKLNKEWELKFLPILVVDTIKYPSISTIITDPRAPEEINIEFKNAGEVFIFTGVIDYDEKKVNSISPYYNFSRPVAKDGKIKLKLTLNPPETTLENIMGQKVIFTSTTRIDGVLFTIYTKNIYEKLYKQEFFIHYTYTEPETYLPEPASEEEYDKVIQKLNSLDEKI